MLEACLVAGHERSQVQTTARRRVLVRAGQSPMLAPGWRYNARPSKSFVLPRPWNRGFDADDCGGAIWGFAKVIAEGFHHETTLPSAVDVAKMPASQQGEPERRARKILNAITQGT